MPQTGPGAAPGAALSRRSFLKLGVAGSLALGSVGLAAGLAGCGRREQAAAQGLRFLRDADVALFRALVPVILGDALPADPAAREARIAETLRGVDAAGDALDPPARRELHKLFDLLHLRVTRWLTTGVAESWERAAPEAVARFLARWRDSSIGAFNLGFRVLLKLVVASFYAIPAAWPLAGYPGPLGWVHRAVNE